MNPSTLLKASKNQVEIAHTRNAMIKDGVALTKFFKWLEEEVATEHEVLLVRQRSFQVFPSNDNPTLLFFCCCYYYYSL